MKEKIPNIGLLGNPNSGKSSLFNYLTGLHQKVSNFPGVTVEKKEGYIYKNGKKVITLIDFPGTYSLFPNSLDERLVVQTLINPKDDHHPDFIIYVADISQLDRHIILATQIKDLGFPMLFVLNMMDILENQISPSSIQKLSQYLACQVIPISTRTLEGMELLNSSLQSLIETNSFPEKKIYNLTDTEKENIQWSKEIADILGVDNMYLAKFTGLQASWLTFLSHEQKEKIKETTSRLQYNVIKSQISDTLDRFKTTKDVVFPFILNQKSKYASISEKLDTILTHKYLGLVIFFCVMFFVFQAIYSWAGLPMEWIESGFGLLSDKASTMLPSGWLSNVLLEGLLPGLAGVLVFIPQIAILFLLLSFLEETGYMSRVVYLFDGWMQKFGLNGRSVVSLISSGACAIPAIMSTRTISDPKERLITILVSPLISCSARLPVYAILIGFVVPATTILGIFNLQGLLFMGLYLMGIFGALISALVFKKILKQESHSHLMIELPTYKPPLWTNVFLTVRDKVWSFVTEAGKVIIGISLVLWFLASFGPGDTMDIAENRALLEAKTLLMNEEDTNNKIASYRLESSYIGRMGRFIEPIIKPLGYDWKIGIALLTSFAAREVFVGTMAVIYSIGSDSDELSIRQKMAAEIRPATGKPFYDAKTAFSLLVFYVFAMQCMSTLAVTRKETGTWKWPIVQFVFMTALAYIGALLVYQFL